MDRDELKGVLAEGFSALEAKFDAKLATLKAELAKSTEIDPEPDTGVTAAQLAEALAPIVASVEALQAATDDLGQVAEKALDHIDSIEKVFAGRQSIEADPEPELVQKDQPTPLAKAVAAVLAKPGSKAEVR